MIALENVVETCHLIAVICWMAGMLYLPRLYVYHADAAIGSENDLMLQVMERRLLKIIMNPAMFAVIGFGLWLAYLEDSFIGSGWLHLKILFVLVLTALHGFFARCRKGFVKGQNELSARSYRILNESVTAVMVIIVFLACAKPF